MSKPRKRKKRVPVYNVKVVAEIQVMGDDAKSAEHAKRGVSGAFLKVKDGEFENRAVGSVKRVLKVTTESTVVEELT